MLGIATLLVASVHATEPVFIPELQFRPRFEADSGRDRDPQGGQVAFVTHRARLGATMEWGPVSARLVFQDVRAWGEERDTRRDFSGDGIDLAIGALTWAPHDRVRLILGREEVGLHDERLVAKAGWRQPGRHFDGGRLTYDDGRWAAEIAGYIVLDGDRFQFTTQDQVEPDLRDQTLWWARGGLQTDDTIAQLLVTLDDRRTARGGEVLRVTPGLFFKADRGILQARLEAYGQLGRIASGGQTVRAGLVGTEIALRPDWTAGPSLILSYDALSGDADPTDDRFTAFDTLRGANHRYYGTLDYAVFFRGGPATAEGLHDPHLALGLKPHARLSIELAQHLFAPAVARDPAWTAWETDLNARWSPLDVLALSGGGAVYLEPASAVGREWFTYLMVDVNLRGPRIGG